MADLCCAYVLPGFTINNATDGVDRAVLGPDGVTGLDGAPIRRQIDPKGQTDGGILHTARFGPRIITFTGFLEIRSVVPGQNDAYYTAINALEAAMVSGLEGIRNSSHNLTWTPTGGSGKSISVRYGVEGQEIQFTGSMLDKGFSFSLVAASPTIS